MADGPVVEVVEAAGATIARRIREVRTRRGWSQDDLSARIRELGGRISRPVLYRIEEGGTRAHRLSVEDFLVIAAALGVAPIYLMTDVREDQAGAPPDSMPARLRVTPTVTMTPPQARAWFVGSGAPPGDDLRFYLSERPESELRQIHEQWAASARAMDEEFPEATIGVPDPRVVDDEEVRRRPSRPPDDRRKTTRRSKR